jgi:hypothetical protein
MACVSDWAIRFRTWGGRIWICAHPRQCAGQGRCDAVGRRRRRSAEECEWIKEYDHLKINGIDYYFRCSWCLGKKAQNKDNP